MISVVIPALDEAALLPRSLRRLRDDDAEFIVVDGGSRDATIEVARRAGARVLVAEPCRARQMNAGAWVAQGDVLLFLHADTVLPAGFAEPVHRVLDRPDVVAGAFRFRTDGTGPTLRFFEAVANWRARRMQMPYGDQALFLRADLFRRLGGFDEELPIMEDFELVRRLRRLGRIELCDASAETSARRWNRMGPWRTWWINQLSVIRWFAGADPQRIADSYRTGRLFPR